MSETEILYKEHENAQNVINRFPELFHFYQRNLYFNDSDVCDNPLVIFVDMMSGESIIKDKDFSNTPSYNSVYLWLSGMDDRGVLEFNRYRKISDETMIQLYNYNIEVFYRSDYKNINSSLGKYDIEAIIRRQTIKNIINE